MRDWNEDGYFAMRNPDTSAGAPFYIVGNDIGISTYTPGGLVTAGPLKGTYFGVNGTVNQLSYGAASGQWMKGGDWEYATSGMLGSNSLQSEDKRKSVFTRASYESPAGSRSVRSRRLTRAMIRRAELLHRSDDDRHHHPARQRIPAVPRSCSGWRPPT